jgi:hypothetical protein
MLKGTPLLCFLFVLLARQVLSGESSVFPEEAFYDYVDAKKRESSDSAAATVSKQHWGFALGISTGASYIPMPWMKKGYYDAYAVPLGIFEAYAPWFYGCGVDFRMGKRGGKTQLRFPLSLTAARISGSAPLHYFQDGDEFAPTAEARISRSHGMTIAEAGAGLSVGCLSRNTLTLSVVPEIRFIAGFSRLTVEKPIMVDYYDSLANVIVSFRAESLPVDHAFGIKAGAGIEGIYSVNGRVSMMVSATVASMWSTILRNSKRGEWVGRGLDGQMREIRFNSMVYGINAGVVIALWKLRS